MENEGGTVRGANDWEVKLPDVGQALAWAAPRLRSVADRPQLEAERLLAALLEVDRATLFAHPEWALGDAQSHLYRQAVERRAAGAPLPYILGRIEFFGLEFVVTPDVLIPRPETELLVEQAAAWLAAHSQARRIIDVGTGSGAIAVSLTVEQPWVHLYATDLSLGALAVARTNALHHTVTDRVTFVQADLLAPIAPPIDLIVTNPPYVAEADWAMLSPSVRQEPRMALTAGPKGLNVIRRLLRQAQGRIAPGGALMVEIGADQGEAVRALARDAFPKSLISVLPDLAGRDRLLEVHLPSA